MKGPFKERHSQVLRCLCFHPPPLYSGLLRPTTPAETISKSWNSVSLSPCQSSWRRWRCLWWWRSTRRSPWPASTTCPTGRGWWGRLERGSESWDGQTWKRMGERVLCYLANKQNCCSSRLLVWPIFSTAPLPACRACSKGWRLDDEMETGRRFPIPASLGCKDCHILLNKII